MKCALKSLWCVGKGGGPKWEKRAGVPSKCSQYAEYGIFKCNIGWLRVLALLHHPTSATSLYLPSSPETVQSYSHCGICICIIVHRLFSLQLFVLTHIHMLVASLPSSWNSAARSTKARPKSMSATGAQRSVNWIQGCSKSLFWHTTI